MPPKGVRDYKCANGEAEQANWKFPDLFGLRGRDTHEPQGTRQGRDQAHPDDPEEHARGMEMAVYFVEPPLVGEEGQSAADEVEVDAQENPVKG